jgi:hypothetical protein
MGVCGGEEAWQLMVTEDGRVISVIPSLFSFRLMLV